MDQVKNTHRSKNVHSFLNSPNTPICLQKKEEIKKRKKNAGEKKLFVQSQVLDGLFNVHTHNWKLSVPCEGALSRISWEE